MFLYHFTSLALYHSILESSINDGHVRLQDGGILKPVVWMTTSPLSNCTGVRSGGVYSEGEYNYAEMIQGGGLKNNIVVDKTKVRIKIDMDKLKLIGGTYKYEEFMRGLNQSKNYTKSLSLSATHNLNNLTDKQLIRLSKTIDNGKSWYLSIKDVPVDTFLSIDFQVSDNQFIPYNYECNGRDGMEALGFMSPSKEKTSYLNNLIEGVVFEPYNILLMKDNDECNPVVLFRVRGVFCMVDICDSYVIFDHSTIKPRIDNSTLIDWVKLEKKYLLTLWRKAENRYEEFKVENNLS